MSCQLSEFTTYTLFPTPRDIHLADKSLIQAHGHGTIDLKVIVKGEKRVVHLSSALYVPNLGNSLLSVKTLNHHQFSIHFTSG
jgi:Pol polyprotein, beta-barrel domain